MTAGYLMLAPVGVVSNLPHAFDEQGCSTGSAAVVRVLDSNSRPVKGVDVYFTLNYPHNGKTQEYFIGTDSDGDVFIRAFGEHNIVVTSLLQKGFDKLQIDRPIETFQLPSNCRERTKKKFLKTMAR